MSNEIVTVWNATGHVVKLGADRVILHPGESMLVERDENVEEYIITGDVVILETSQEQPVVADSSSKKKKKETVTEEPTVSNTVDSTPSGEVSEDSILPDTSV